MSDILPVSLQDILHSRKSDLRTQQIIKKDFFQQVRRSGRAASLCCAEDRD